MSPIIPIPLPYYMYLELRHKTIICISSFIPDGRKYVIGEPIGNVVGKLVKKSQTRTNQLSPKVYFYYDFYPLYH